jgi:Transposase DDE domain group 1
MPKGPRKLAITFGAVGLTHFGGVYLLHRFLTRIGFKAAVAKDVTLAQRNNRYTVGELLLAILYPIILGLERIETTQLLQHNGVFRYLSGLSTYPDPTTLRRFLLRMTPQALIRLRKLHDRFLARMISKPHLPSRLILDLDSTVLVVYGKQQGAEVGYNPTKHGRRSYHPLLCFEGRTKDFWHGELRPGNVHSASGTLDLLKACFAKIPSEIRSVIIRADKGFYDHRIVECLEECKACFVIVARLTRPIKRKLAHLKYVSVSAGVQAAEFHYQPSRWSHSYRFVVIRRPQPEEPDPQLTLFKLGKYHYQVLVTNLDLRPLNLWRFYNGRAGIERIIRELKGDYPLGKIPTRHFFANEAYLHLLLLAYSLVNWFKRLCLPSEFQSATLDTLRNRILLMPAQLLRSGNRPRLAMPTSGRRENAWKHALHRIEKLRL